MWSGEAGLPWSRPIAVARAVCWCPTLWQGLCAGAAVAVIVGVGVLHMPLHALGQCLEACSRAIPSPVKANRARSLAARHPVTACPWVDRPAPTTLHLLAFLLRCSEMPGELQKVLEWFRDYKIPDGKPANKFGYDNKCMNKEFTVQVGVLHLR